MKDKFSLPPVRQILPYAGILVICTALLLVHVGRLDAFFLLRCELIAVFGYISAVVDLKVKRIPNIIVLAMLASWAIIMVPKLFFSIDEAISILLDSALGFAIGGGLFFLVYLISHKGLGGGDVKFMAAAGLFLGFNGVLPTMLCGTILAALTGLVLILLKKIGRKDSMPLVPFIYAGILITVFFI